MASLPEARYVPDKKAWQASVFGITEIWAKHGLDECDWNLLPWEYGLCPAPPEPAPVVPGARELAGSDGTPRFFGDVHDFQSEAASFLFQRRRAILGDDVGLGKTASAIRALLKGEQEGTIRRALIVTRASLKRQWAEELERMAGIEALVIEGDAKRRARLWQEAGRVVIVNYELLIRKDLDHMLAFAPDALIFDECHYLKNQGAKRTKAALRLSRGRPYWWGLSATPTTGKLEEIWSLFQFIAPDLLGKVSHFTRRYCVPAFRRTEHGRRFMGFKDYKNRPVLRHLIRPYLMARKAGQVAGQLPALIEIPHRLDPTPAQETLFERLESRLEHLDEMLAKAPQGRAREIEDAKTATLMFMVMASDDPALLMGSESSTARKLVEGIASGSPKLDELAELAQGWASAGHSFVVFTEFVRMVELIQERLSGIRVELEELEEPVSLQVWTMTGETPARRREEIKQAFQEAETPACLVLDRAGQEGLNLQKASVVCLFDLPWTPTDVHQRLGRIRRLSSRHDSVRLYLLLTRGSIDEKILTLHGKRQENIAAVS